jgi:hypothetical protein
LEKSRSIRNTNLFTLRIEQKFKDCTIQQSAACKGNKHFLPLMRPQALGGTTLHLCSYSWIHPLYESQNNKPDLLLLMGILGLFFCLLDSTLAITSWHTITNILFNPALYYLFFGLQK